MRKKVLILGVRGMLGHVLYRSLANNPKFEVYATTTGSSKDLISFPAEMHHNIFTGIDAENSDNLLPVFSSLQPQVVINCIAVIREAEIKKNPLFAININSVLPHKLVLLCKDSGARLIQISTDSLFGDDKSMYKENDKLRVSDLYSMTKVLGEVNNSNCITIRTSIIGHELVSKSSFVEWFLAQDKKVRGFSKVIYAGFPTIELAEIIGDYILPNEKLAGIYHLSSNPISKYTLLQLIARLYEKKVEIEENNTIETNRLLDSSLFRSVTGYEPPSWEVLVNKMNLDYIKHQNFYNNTYEPKN